VHLTAPPPTQAAPPGALFRTLAAISIAHLLHDTIQSLVPAIYPILKVSYDLSFAQIGLITLTLQVTASVLQPVVGFTTDRRPRPYALVGGMVCSLVGLLILAAAPRLALLILGAGIIGLGSAIFHPESSRVARLASGGQHGLAQSVFQVGGNFGSSLGPLVAAFVVVPYGQASLAWCGLLAVAALVLLWRIGGWYQQQAPEVARRSGATAAADDDGSRLDARRVRASLAILLALVFSKYAYLTSLTSFYTLYLISRFDVSVQRAQIDLFVFLAAVAAGTIVGGPVGDRFGRKPVIWGSILGVLPFTLLLPLASLGWTRVLVVIIGLVIASAFSAILVFAQELLPNRVGLVAGLFFGTAFGVAGLGAAVLGYVADRTSIEFVYGLCAFLPIVGLLAGFLPDAKARAV
jgi:FSR family fosmidomycin resistance protein-like MFS transporter